MRGKSFGSAASPVQRLGSASSGGPTLLQRVFLDTPGAWTVTAPAGTARVDIWGKGAGGSGGCNTNSFGGGGGAGVAAFASKKISPGAQLSCTVGQGGNSQQRGNAPFAGQPGTATTVTIDGATVIAADYGRGGGSSYQYSGGPAGTVGASIGDIVRAGGRGGDNNFPATSVAGGGPRLGSTYDGGGCPGFSDLPVCPLPNGVGSGSYNYSANGNSYWHNTGAPPGGGGAGGYQFSSDPMPGGHGVICLEFWSA